MKLLNEIDPDLSIWHLHPIPMPTRGDWAILSEEERARASRFRLFRDRDRFVQCRATLRRAVSQRTGQLPEQLIIDYGPHGKPFIRDSEFRFNLSHSQDHALLAIAVGREVGIDIECVDGSFDPVDLAERFFHPDERQAILECPPDQQRRAFLRRWVRKEAVAKASGVGIAELIDAPFEIPKNCEIRDIDLGSGVVAAVAMLQKYS